MNYQCPHCQAEVEIADAFIGANVECEHCKQEFHASAPDRPVQAFKGPSKKARAQAAIEQRQRENRIARTGVCERCGAITPLKKSTPGSIAVEIVLWCLLLIPGVLYSLWRLTNRKMVCRVCKAESVVPIGTPRGQKLVHEFHPGFEV